MTTRGFFCVLGRAGGEDTTAYPARGLPPPLPLGPGAWHHAGPDAQAFAPSQGEDAPGVLFHGELHGLPALRRQLDAEGLPVAWVLARAYRRWGDDLTRHLDGLYALAVLNGREVRLFRDASGARGLFHAALPGGGLAFATRLDTLLRVPGLSRQLAPGGLHEYLRFLDIAAPNTLYAGVGALEPGHVLSWRPGQAPRTEPAATPEPAPAPTGFEAARDTLETLLRQGIARRLEGAARPAAFLSGGVDSALLCALGAGVRQDLTAVTVGFSGARYDETPMAAAIARHLGLAHAVLRYERADYVRAFAEFQVGAEQPVGDPATPPTLLAFRDCRTRFDAVLDGSGADESLGLMPPRHARVAVAYGALLPPWLRRAGTTALARVPGLAGYTPLLDFAHPAEPLIRWKGFTQAEIGALTGAPVHLEDTRFYRTFARFPRGAHFARYSALLDVMPGDRLHEGARLSGLALRFPYWDPAVDGYIRALPVSYRYREGTPKRLLRALLARHVPRALWDVPKHGFDFPLLAFLRDDGHALVKRYLLDAPWRDWGVLSAAAVEALARRFMAGDDGLMFRAWALAVLAAWLENHDWRY